MAGRKIGTLIVVVLKGRNLPNKRHIGKQDPYCVCKLSGETRRTPAVKRGGQHPEWDDELRFPIYETAEEELARTGRGGGDSPPPPPPKDDAPAKGPTKRLMTLMCYADDPREPELIGETVVDLTESLSKGETDEWYTLNSKGKYSGEIYLEMTYWLEEAPPAPKKVAPQQPVDLHPQYGGPGDFTPASEAIPASLRSGPAPGRTRKSSVSPIGGSPLRSDAALIPESLRPSSSLAKLDLYIPPYQEGNTGRRSAYGRESLPSRESSYDDQRQAGFGELGVGGYQRRRESFPPPQQVRHSSFGAPQSYASPVGSAFTPTNGMANSFSMMSLAGQQPPHQPPAQQPYVNTYNQSQYPPAGFVSNSQVPFPNAVPSAFVAPQAPYVPPSSSMGFHPPASHFAPAQSPYPPSATPAPFSAPPSVPYPPATPAPYPSATPAPYPSPTPAPYAAYQQYPQPNGAPYQQPPQAAPYPPQPAPTPAPAAPTFYNNAPAPYYPTTTPASVPPPPASAPPQTYYPPQPAAHPQQHHSLPATPAAGPVMAAGAVPNPSALVLPPPPPPPNLYRGTSPNLIPPGQPPQQILQHSPPSMAGSRPLPAQPGVLAGSPARNLPGPPPPLPFQAPPPPPPLAHSYQR